MTTSHRTSLRRSLAFVFACALSASAPACISEGVGKRGGLKQDVIDKFPQDVQASYELFEHKCSRCHTLARPLNAPIYELAHWEVYVTRMRRQQGSGISESDGQTILVFLKYYAEKKKRERDSEGGLASATGTTAASGGPR